MIVPGTWPLIADVAVPVVSVLTSGGIAILLARSERMAAARDRIAERALAAEDRADERARFEEDRTRMKTEESFEKIVGTLAWFISAHPGIDEWQPQMRLLRGQAKIAQAVPASEAQDFAFWFASEVHRGLKEAELAMVQYGLALDTLHSDDIQAAVEQIMHPFRSWANLTIDLVVIWLRENTSIAELEQMANGAAKLKWDPERIEDQARRNGWAD